MKKSRHRKKLELARKTIRHLGEGHLREVVGGATNGQCSGQGGTEKCDYTQAYC